MLVHLVDRSFIELLGQKSQTMSVHSGRLLRTSQTGENYLLVLLQTASIYYNINYAMYGNAVLCYV